MPLMRVYDSEDARLGLDCRVPVMIGGFATLGMD